MTRKSAKSRTAAGAAASHRLAHAAEGGASGAVAGAVVGANAGPPGAIAGAIIGGIAGVMAADALDGAASQRAARTRELDAEIGVSEGTLGAPNLQHPPSRR